MRLCKGVGHGHGRVHFITQQDLFTATYVMIVYLQAASILHDVLEKTVDAEIVESVVKEMAEDVAREITRDHREKLKQKEAQLVRSDAFAHEHWVQVQEESFSGRAAESGADGKAFSCFVGET